MTSIPFSSIIEGDRIRQKQNYGDLTGLKESLQAVGSIHPIVLTRSLQNIDPQKAVDCSAEWLHENNKYSYVLIAGGRRYAAMKSLGIKELWHGSVLNPDRLGYVFDTEVSEARRREAEIDENLYRLDVSWIDNVLAIADAHKHHVARNLKWGYRQTAAMFGNRSGISKSNVGYCTTIAEYLRKGDKEFLACTSLSDAMCLHMKRDEDAALAELQRRNAAKVGASPLVRIELGGPTGTGSFLDALNATLGPKIDFTNTNKEFPKQIAAVANEPTPSAPVDLPLSQMFRLGDSLRVHMPAFPDACFDHIVTDIPYGIDTDNMTEKDRADIEAQHNVELNINQMPIFLEQALRLVKPNGFCIFFMDMDHWNLLAGDDVFEIDPTGTSFDIIDGVRTTGTWKRQVGLAEKIGWRVQNWPLLWIKTHPCQNQAPNYNYTKEFEIAMVLRKDAKTVLRKPRPSCVYVGDGAAERKLYNNKFAKPFMLWKTLIFDNIAFPGQSIYDPFAGECSSLRAAANCGLIPWGSEIEPVHFNRGVEHLKAVYALIHQSNVRFT